MQRRLETMLVLAALAATLGRLAASAEFDDYLRSSRRVIHAAAIYDDGTVLPPGESSSAPAELPVRSAQDYTPEISFDECLDPPKRCGQWLAGYEQTFLRPRFENGFGLGNSLAEDPNFSDLAGVVGPFEDRSLGFVSETAPRIWIGRVDDELCGWRARYWQFDHAGQSLVEPNFPQAGLNTILAGGLEMWTLDVEATKSLDMCYWSLTFAGGLRYGTHRMDSNVTINNGITVEVFNFGEGYHGIGPTFALEAYEPLLESNLSVFANGRVSVLFGEQNQRLLAVDNDGTPVVTSTQRNDTIPVLEGQVGLEWSYPTTCGRWFVRSALEGQIWFDAGNPYGDDGNLDLYGFTVGAGVDY